MKRISGVEVTYDDGTTVAWTGTGTVDVTHTTSTSRIPPPKPDVHYVTAILTFERPSEGAG